MKNPPRLLRGSAVPNTVVKTISFTAEPRAKLATRRITTRTHDDPVVPGIRRDLELVHKVHPAAIRSTENNPGRERPDLECL